MPDDLKQSPGVPSTDPPAPGQRVDDASGQKVGPPGGMDTDERRLADAHEDLEKAGAGH